MSPDALQSIPRRGRARGPFSRRGFALQAGPPLAYLLVLTVFPAAYSLFTSFQSTPFGSPAGWAGFSNYAAALSSPYFREAALTTLILIAGAFVLEMALGVAIAVLLDASASGPTATFLQVVMVIALFTPSMVTGLAWHLIFVNTFGVWQYLVHSRYLPVLNVMPAAIIAIIVANAWQWTPFIALIVFGGLTTLPHEVTEAAQADGAGWFQTVIHIKLPGVTQILMVAGLLRFIQLTKMFASVFTLTGGGPGIATRTVTFQIWQATFMTLETGQGAAESWMLVIAVSILVTILASRLPLFRDDGVSHA